MNVEVLAKIKEALPGNPIGFLKRCVTDLVRRNEVWRAAFVPGTLIRYSAEDEHPRDLSQVVGLYGI